MSKTLSNRICSVERSLLEIGDPWSFLILREAFFGAHYYDQFLGSLGIATNILSDRLKKLCDHEILKRTRDKNDARRVYYRLTEKGRDLYPITLALLNWGDKWLSDESGPPLELYHAACGKKLEPITTCKACGKPVKLKEVSYRQRLKPR